MNAIQKEKARRKIVAEIKKQKIRPETVAVALDMSWTGVNKWITGQRTPRLPTIRLFESTFGVKIL